MFIYDIVCSFAELRRLHCHRSRWRGATQSASCPTLRARTPAAQPAAATSAAPAPPPPPLPPGLQRLFPRPPPGRSAAASPAGAARALRGRMQFRAPLPLRRRRRLRAEHPAAEAALHAQHHWAQRQPQCHRRLPAPPPAPVAMAAAAAAAAAAAVMAAAAAAAAVKAALSLLSRRPRTGRRCRRRRRWRSCWVMGAAVAAALPPGRVRAAAPARRHMSQSPQAPARQRVPAASSAAAAWGPSRPSPPVAPAVFVAVFVAPGNQGSAAAEPLTGSCEGLPRREAQSALQPLARAFRCSRPGAPRLAAAAAAALAAAWAAA